MEWKRAVRSLLERSLSPIVQPARSSSFRVTALGGGGTWRRSVGSLPSAPGAACAKCRLAKADFAGSLEIIGLWLAVVAFLVRAWCPETGADVNQLMSYLAPMDCGV